MILKQCRVSDIQVLPLFNRIANSLCEESRFCSKVLSQKVKLPFAWNDAIHHCQNAKHCKWPGLSELMPCFASAKFPESLRMAVHNSSHHFNINPIELCERELRSSLSLLFTV